MKNRKNLFPQLLSLILALAMICTPATCFAAETSDDYVTVSMEEVVENNETVKIYNVNDGSNLAQIAANLKGRDYESIIGFDVDGRILFNNTSYIADKAYTSATTRRNFQRDYGTTIVHNHPSSQSFSARDLKAEATYNTPRAMVISDLYVYILEPMSTGWGDPTQMETYWQQRYDVYYAEARNFIYNWSYNRNTILNTPDTPDDGSCAWYCQYMAKQSLRADPNAKIDLKIGIWITHRVMQDVAQRFNMLYYRTSRADFDFTDETIFYSEAIARRQLQDRYGYWY